MKLVSHESEHSHKLIPHDTEHCLFRILPRYKVRSVGDEVDMHRCDIVAMIIPVYVTTGTHGRSSDIC